MCTDAYRAALTLDLSPTPGTGRARAATIAAVASASASGPASPAPGAVPGDLISPDEFFRADVRVGQVLRAEEFPEARNPSYKLWIDFGELGTRASSAQLTTLYQSADLVGRLVIAVVNFPPRRIAGFSSEVLVLGVPAGRRQDVALIQPDRQVPPGTAVF
jgi:tRNA-binding protein